MTTNCTIEKQKSLIELPVTVPQPHDRLFRSCIAIPEVAEDLLRAFLPQQTIDRLDLSTISIFSESHVNKWLQSTTCDAVYKIKYREQAGDCYVIIEHQSSACLDMPYRALHYQTAIMDRVSLQQKSRRPCYPLVYLLVIYHADDGSAYPYPTDIREQIKAPRDLVLPRWGKTFDLHDLANCAHQEERLVSVVIYALRYSRESSFDPYFPTLVRLIKVHCKVDKNGNIKRYAETVLKYVVSTASLSKAAYFEYVEQLRGKTWGEIGMTMAEHFRQQGEERGIERGIERGAKLREREMVEALLQNGVELSFLASTLNIDIFYIRRNSKNTSIECRNVRAYHMPSNKL